MHYIAICSRLRFIHILTYTVLILYSKATKKHIKNIMIYEILTLLLSQLVCLKELFQTLERSSKTFTVQYYLNRTWKMRGTDQILYSVNKTDITNRTNKFKAYYHMWFFWQELDIAAVRYLIGTMEPNELSIDTTEEQALWIQNVQTYRPVVEHLLYGNHDSTFERKRLISIIK